MARPKTIKPEIKEIEKYNINLSMGDKVFESTGDTAHDAIKNLPLNFMDVKAKGNITLSFSGKSHTRLFTLILLRKLIANKMFKVGVAKQMEALLK